MALDQILTFAYVMPPAVMAKNGRSQFGYRGRKRSQSENSQRGL